MPLRPSDLLAWLRKAFPPRILALWSTISFLVALAGPFGTYAEMRPPGRLLYWTCIFGLAIAVARLCRRIVRPFLAGLRFWTRGVIVSAVFASVFAPMARLLHDQVVSGADVRPVPVLTVWIVIFLTSIVETALWSVTRQAEVPQRIEAEVAVTVPASRLLSRLDPELRGELRSLSVRDHYVVVTTDRGQGNLLLRFADALDELGGVEGLRVHRSHWVAQKALDRVEREAGRIFLRLKDGRQIPVSRSYREAVLALGLPATDLNGTARGDEPSSTARASGRISAERAGSVQESPPV